MPRAHLYFNGVFYLNFRTELLILLIGTTFSGLLHCPLFFIAFRSKMHFSKVSNPNVCTITLIWMKIAENWIYHYVSLWLDFLSCKMDKKHILFDHRLICKIFVVADPATLTHLFYAINNDLYYREELHFRCLTGFWIHLCIWYYSIRSLRCVF